MDEASYLEFWRRWREIDRLWQPCGDPQHFATIAGLRAHARAKLYEEFAKTYVVGPALWAIPIAA